MSSYESVLRLIPEITARDLGLYDKDLSKINEIRLRVNKNPIMIMSDGEIIGKTLVDKRMIMGIVEQAVRHSIYAYENDLKNGFLTVKGGHRFGIGGEVIIDKGEVKNFSNITFLCIRIARQVFGCSNSYMDFVLKNDVLKHTLIISAPGCGKTTILRDIVRNLSNYKYNISLIDERSELAACCNGIPENDVGMRTDVIDKCPKAEAMIMAVRALSPDVIATDEIGGIDDINAIKYCIHCGCIVIGTIHGTDMEDCMLRPHFRELIGQGYFERIIELEKCNKKGRVRKCIDLQGQY